LPNAHGFDYYFGIPYSNDMDQVNGLDYYEACIHPKVDNFNVPLMQNSRVIERPADQNTLTRRYTEEALKFISQKRDNPFFLYLAHPMTYVPLFRSKGFVDKSLRGIYGDVTEELDWSMGEILDKLKETGLDKNTLVVFTSDNGPWTIFNEYGGSAGLLKGGKGSTYEGGMREPTIFWWPGKIKHKVIMDCASTLDLFPTFCSLADINLPSDRIYDGYDLSQLMLGTGRCKREVLFYYRDTEIFAVRKGAYKVHFKTQDGYGQTKPVFENPPLLYNIEVDPSEKFNIAVQHPDIIEEIRHTLKEHLATVKPVENQLDKN
jgi:arylsulfatase A-like enzyme